MPFFPSRSSQQTLTLTEDIQLDYPQSADTGTTKLTDYIDVEPLLDAQALVLPNAQDTGPGWTVNFTNIGSFHFKIEHFDKSPLVTMLPGDVVSIYLTDRSATSNGEWAIVPFGGGVVGITALDLSSSDNSVDITGGVVTSPTATVDFKLHPITASIENLAGGSAGIAVLNDALTPSWSVASIVGGANIDVENGDAVGGNPTISLQDEIAVVQLKAGDIEIDNRRIRNTLDNSELYIVSDGTGSLVNINGVLIDNIGNMGVPGNLIHQGVAKASCRFTNMSGTISLVKSSGITSVVESGSQYTITFENPMMDTNYRIIITPDNKNSSPPLQVRLGAAIVRELNSVVIVMMDGAGEMLADFPEGVDIVIFE